MTEKKPVKSIARHRLDYFLADGTFVLTLPADKNSAIPHVKIKPGYNKAIGPHLTIKKVLLGEHGDEHAIILRLSQAASLLRALPALINTAKRLESKRNPRRSMQST